MKARLFSTLALLALLLAACAPAAQTAAAPTAIPATGATSAPTQAQPTTPPAATAGATPAASPAAGGDDVRAYAIVPEESSVTYSVGEVFFNDNNRFNLAVGKTQKISGDVLLNFTHPEQSTLGTISVDISAFESDSSRRDNAIRGRWLESARFPLATFAPTAVSGLTAGAQAGQTLNFQVTGDLTVRDTTRPVTFDVQARLENETLQGAASAEILMSDFGFSPPDIAGMLKAEDKVKIDFTFVARPNP